jgi:hypothetical protein
MAAEPTSWVSDFFRVVAPVTMLTFAINWFFAPSKDVFRRRIDSVHPDDRKWLREIFSNTPIFPIYRKSIRRAVELVESVVGLPWTKKAFIWCLTIAATYPFIIFFIFWTFTGTEIIGTSHIPFIKRFVVLFTLFMMIMFSVWFTIKNGYKFMLSVVLIFFAFFQSWIT